MRGRSAALFNKTLCHSTCEASLTAVAASSASVPAEAPLWPARHKQLYCRAQDPDNDRVVQAARVPAGRSLDKPVHCAPGLLEVWDFRTRFAPLMEWEPPPPLEALQRAATAQGDDGAAVFMQLLSPIITDVRTAALSEYMSSQSQSQLQSWQENCPAQASTGCTCLVAQ